MTTTKNLFVVLLLALLITGCSSNSDSYNLGYEQGSSELFSQAVFYRGMSPQLQCSLNLSFAKGGTPNDGTNWESIDAGDFLKGCYEGYKDAHPEMNLK